MATSKFVRCPNCHGSKKQEGYFEEVKCPECKGTRYNTKGEYAGCFWCRHCNYTGVVRVKRSGRVRCVRCCGTGQVYEYS
jgi:ribosomal protein S27E